MQTQGLLLQTLCTLSGSQPSRKHTASGAIRHFLSAAQDLGSPAFRPCCPLCELQWLSGSAKALGNSTNTSEADLICWLQESCCTMVAEKKKNPLNHNLQFACPNIHTVRGGATRVRFLIHPAEKMCLGSSAALTFNLVMVKKI